MKKRASLIWIAPLLAAAITATLSCNGEKPASETSSAAPQAAVAKRAANVAVGSMDWQVPVDVTAVPRRIRRRATISTSVGRRSSRSTGRRFLRCPAA
jgi:hypothetical protein